MREEALKHLRDMEKKKDKRQFNFEEIEKIHKCLRECVKADDANEALDLSASIAEAQVKGYGTDVDSLLDTILYQGDLKGAEDATQTATDSKLWLAAKFVDSEQYDKFENMSFEHVNKDFFVDEDEDVASVTEYATEGIDEISSAIMQRVKTLKGAQYLVDNGKIQSEYFTNDYMGALNNASLEQLEFFVKQGANINAGAAIDMPYGELSQDYTLLDLYTEMDTPESLEYMKEIIRLGGQRMNCEFIPYYLDNHNNITKLYAEKFLLLSQSGMLNDREKHSLREAINGRTDEEAKTHIDTAKDIMKLKRIQRGGMDK